MTTKQKMALANIARVFVRYLQKFRGRGPVGIYRRGGISFELDLDEGIDFSIYLLGAFEVETSRACLEKLKSGHIVFDIGANIGAHTLPFANAVGENGKVHAFEPTDYAIQKLKRNLELNPKLLDRVIINQVFLGDGSLQVPPDEICSSWPLQGAEKVHPAHQGVPKSTHNAALITLDKYAIEKEIRRLDLIKLDVDGNEAGVIRGGLNLLDKFRPVILMELWRDTEESHALLELIQLLKQIQARVFSVSGHKEFFLEEMALKKCIPFGGSINVFVYPFKK